MMSGKELIATAICGAVLAVVVLLLCNAAAFAWDWFVYGMRPAWWVRLTALKSRKTLPCVARRELAPKQKAFGELAHSFRVELILCGEFYDNLARIVRHCVGEDGLRKLKHQDLRGFEEFRASDFVKTLLENIQGRVALQFESHLLNAYRNAACIYHADARGYWDGCPVYETPLHAEDGDADAGTMPAEVDERVDDAEDEGGTRDGNGAPADVDGAEKMLKEVHVVNCTTNG